ncbi:hypothetical protein EVAR_34364_1 [Eumeta japonica]|uniref:Uncharacterized protein n=1 Tax=Eumeta variegata TaxID=151549 RepID=A0A4C1YS57_EUMVA|nr:hypothetical protein EVAR_34364_1 [Eumeta japonica]
MSYGVVLFSIRLQLINGPARPVKYHMHLYNTKETLGFDQRCLRLVLCAGRRDNALVSGNTERLTLWRRLVLTYTECA